MEKKKCSRYHHFTHGYQKSQSYDVWFLKYGVRQTESFVILGYYLLFYYANDTEDQNFGTMKKKPGDIIILYMCMINEDHMIDGS